MAETLNTIDLAQAISEGLNLAQIAQQMGCTSLTVTRVLYGHYAHATLPAGLTGPAFRHYMGLRHDAIRLCQKAGVGPLDPRKEDTQLPKLNKVVRATLSRASLAGDLAAGRSFREMAEKRGVTESTIRGYLHRHGLLGDRGQDAADDATLVDAIAGIIPAQRGADNPGGRVAPQSLSEASEAVRPSSEGHQSSDQATDKPAPQAGAGRGVQEEGAVPAFRTQVSDAGIDIHLSAANLLPYEVRRYLQVVEGNLELAGEGLELHLSIRGPRR